MNSIFSSLPFHNPIQMPHHLHGLCLVQAFFQEHAPDVPMNLFQVLDNIYWTRSTLKRPQSPLAFSLSLWVSAVSSLHLTEGSGREALSKYCGWPLALKPIISLLPIRGCNGAAWATSWWPFTAGAAEWSKFLFESLKSSFYCICSMK